ncbi:50S ribosome-binding GTPase (macronuclear) [Tetrahymena thermophila SB210]|uniref:50S ribosome-binding GTPase n=1 Tax=Tetrahymena thermophila (strain SB210) TaxID=312017 RepID=Q23FS3_TETTS|nr:50S ribosome-binding GTPase [Tetrahymena thermophila SB210]EAR95537.2 50S ribosome-binding GTPase [Tetrahymena thermophila SB210]|eukprot:XP_001015782.2 50S ribosome-binding GTPase [Tetrahymena thermophila SB210]
MKELIFQFVFQINKIYIAVNIVNILILINYFNLKIIINILNSINNLNVFFLIKLYLNIQTNQQIQSVILPKINSCNSTVNQIKRIKRITNYSYQQLFLELMNSSECYTLVYGLTGSGKSSLLNVLCGKEFTSKSQKLVFNDTIFKVSANKISQTENYQEKYMNSINMIFVDTPGIKDTNLQKRVNNLYKLHSYFKAEGNLQKQFKFIFLISEPEIVAIRGQEISILMDELFQLFKNIEIFQDSALVVFSKVRPYPLNSEGYQDQIQNLRENFFEIIDGEKSQNTLKFFKSIPEKNYLSFSNPHSEIECKIVKDERDAILHSLKDKIQSVNKIELNTEHQLDAQVKIFMKQQFDEFQQLKDETNKLIFDYLVKEIIEEAEIKQEQKTQQLKQIKQEIQEFKCYKDLLEKINCCPNLRQELEKLYDILLKYNTIEKCHKDQFNLNEIKFIDQIINQTNEKHDGQTLTLKAFYLHSSEMYEKILKKYSSSNLKKIILIIEHSFIFDSQLFSFHGGSLDLRCKKFIISKFAQKIDLSGQRNKDINDQFKQQSGKNGEDRQEQDGEDGEDGLPGDPGENGGSFLMSIENISGIISKDNKITVDVSGGKGYDGQNGGNGGKGGKGKNGDLKGIENKDKKYLKYVVDVTGVIKNIISLNKEYAFYYESQGQKGFKGGNCGKGGSGGLQGNPGDFKIISWNKSQIESKHILVIKTQGLKGEDGICGQPGPGGKGGKNVIGVYTDEYFCPTLRGITKEMKKLKEEKSQNDIDLVDVRNVALNGATTAVWSIAVGEAAVSVGLVSLARFVALPAGIFQAVTSAFMAAQDSKVVAKPEYKGRADKGNDGECPTIQKNSDPDTSIVFCSLE